MTPKAALVIKLSESSMRNGTIYEPDAAKLYIS